jgi:MoxR-like ATPase
VAVVAASNEVPADEALMAFYDRFLVRVPVSPVGEGSFASLLALDDRGGVASVDAPVTPGERDAVQRAAAQVSLGDSFVDACTALRRWVAETHEPALSDRRWRQFVGLARTAAASEGRTALDAYDLWLAPYVASARPERVPVLQQWFEQSLLALPPAGAPWLERAVQAFEKQLEIEQAAPADGDGGDDGAGKLALARAIGTGIGEGEHGEPGMQRIVSARLEQRLLRRWSSVHIRCRVEQAMEIESQVAQARAEVAARAQAQARALAGRVWMPPALCAKLAEAHAQALQMLDGIASRLAAAREGFAALPSRDEPEAHEPQPVAIEADAGA